MKNKEWLQELNELNNSETTPEMAAKEMKELEEMLEAAIIKKKQEQPESDWDRIMAAKRFVHENKLTFQTDPRQFNQQSYDANDKIAKDLMIIFLTKKGHIITQSEETYSTDIITNKGKYEVEMSSKDFTTRQSFPYEKVNFLGRKAKYGNDYHYVIISKNQQYALVAAAKDIFKEDNKTTVYCNTNRNGYDEVYQLNKDQVKFFQL
jgi:DNA gyrase/topoisomerase IV subunit A